MTELKVTTENVTKCGFGIRICPNISLNHKINANNLKVPKNNISLRKLGSAIMSNLDMSHMRQFQI